MTNDELFSKLSERIGEILKRLERPIPQYHRTRYELTTCNVISHEDYRKNFAHFYRLARRSQDWKDHYFTLLEQSKFNSAISFADTLYQLKKLTGRIEPSFSSKLVATINPERPVIDSVVLGVLGYKQPYAYKSDRCEKLEELYQRLTARLESMIMDTQFDWLKQRFLLVYPGYGFTDIKILDFMLWQLREPKPKKKQV